LYKRLFIPGPTHVRDEVLMAQAVPMIGHRSPEYSSLQQEVTSRLQQLLYTRQRVYLFASSSTGIMEGAVRQASRKRVLNTVCGAFSKRWHDITVSNGIACDAVAVPWGSAVTPELVDNALASGEYDALTIVMNETSTGVMNPVKDITEMIHKKHPGVLILVDAVSCMAGVKIELDAWGLDVCFAGVQKCFALPPGLTVCAVSDRARERAAQVPNPGYYFCYQQMDSKYDKHQTPATPAISLIQALRIQLEDILREGLEARWASHREMAEHVQEWARARFALFADERYLSSTVTNVVNTCGISVAELNAALGSRGAMISNGYGNLKEKCFRVAHMGDLTVENVRWLTDQIDDILDS
jgi:aspartate aminotransferase-like enzyme